MTGPPVRDAGNNNEFCLCGHHESEHAKPGFSCGNAVQGKCFRCSCRHFRSRER